MSDGIKNHEAVDSVITRYVYILKVNNRGRKSKFYGLKKCFYTGQTDDIVRRCLEHLSGINSKFLFANFRDAQKKLVYVETLEGTEYDSLARELEVKRLSHQKKEDLIVSERNQLVNYSPLKSIVVRVGDHDVLFRFGDNK